jgi:Cu/Ag efflux pump CusA
VGQDIYRARQTVSERVTAVAADLPSQVDPPASRRCRRSWARSCSSRCARTGTTTLALRTIAEAQVRRRLLAVPGVSQVVATGGGERQFQVIVSPDRLTAAGVSI